MIDRDGIERPDESGEHTFTMPTYKSRKPLKYRLVSRNPLIRFGAYLLRIFVYIILTVLFAFMYRLKSGGKNNLRAVKNKGVVIVGNHAHYVDVAFHAIKAMPRMLWVTSIPENFYIPVCGSLVKMLGGIPIAYDIQGMRKFKAIVDDLLERKKAVMFFSEGSMWPYYRGLRPFKNGAFRFAARHNAPILPAVTAIQIVHKSLSKRRYRIKVVYLPAIYPDPDLPEAQASEKLKLQVHAAMSEFIESACENDIYTRKYQKQKAKQEENANQDNISI